MFNVWQGKEAAVARREEGGEGLLGIAFMHNFRFMVGHGHRNKPRVYELAKKRK